MVHRKAPEAYRLRQNNESVNTPFAQEVVELSKIHYVIKNTVMYNNI